MLFTHLSEWKFNGRNFIFDKVQAVAKKWVHYFNRPLEFGCDWQSHVNSTFD